MTVTAGGPRAPARPRLPIWLARIGRADVADLDAAVLPDGPLYVHLDLDVTDPAGIPGLRPPASDGPDSTEVSRALRALLATGRVAAVGVASTWHPGHDAAAAVEPCLKSALAAGH